MIRRTIISLLLTFGCFVSLFAQMETPVKWNISTEKVNEKEINIIFDATIENHWHLYSQYFEMGGPMPLYFEFTQNEKYSLIDSVIESPKPKVEFDEVFEIEVKFFEKNAKFVQKIEVKTEDGFNVPVKLDGQACFDDGKCIVIALDTLIPINGGEKVATENTSSKATTPILVTENKFPLDANADNQSLFMFFLISILFGVISILTPCVFPMIPMTISFFMQGQKSKFNSIIKALIFGISITLLYTLVGVIVSLTSAGADFTTTLSSHWIPNLIFFLLFVVFASSLFGLFEFAIPTGLANKADRQVDKGGLLAAFFLAITLVIVSFACTGPIVGALLVQAASGNFLQPTIGMFGFGLGFAIPFTILAIIPKALNKIPKSGSWMNSVKIII